MTFEAPPANEVRAAFPDLIDLTFHKRGGFKAVYFGKLNGVKETLKLVFIPQGQGADEVDRNEIEDENIKRVQREIAILGNCPSPFVVKLGQVPPTEVVIKETHFIAYSEEYLDGADLDSLIKSGHRPSERELRRLMVCLLSAVKDLWSSLGVVHRDIKPLNVIKLESGPRDFVLLDLGIAYAIRGTALTINPVNIPGSLYYLAPEMLRQNFRATLDYKSDLYTIGLTAYEYATAIQPFARGGEAPGQTLSRIISQTPAPLKTLRPDLQDNFCQTVDLLLKKLPALRPSNIDRLISLLEGKQ
ncbi:MAG: protein kinase [Bacteroidetes bacterium]|nr:protein kinase [Bacteroidota bacterium]